ncbi:MAG TPA: outer membrane lipoprotein carrier protein LolA [Myxococcota bacterium]|nr:outer membrane lipoprotein carrier protein LolA [Myxococcota bacterium]
MVRSQARAGAARIPRAIRALARSARVRACAASKCLARVRAIAASSMAAALALPALAASAEPLSLEQLMAAMAARSGVIANFRESKRIALLTEPLESSGTLYFAPPDRFARVTREPDASLLVVDGERLRFQQGASTAFDLSGNPIAQAFVDNFIALFSGDLPRLQKIYRTDFRADGERWSLALAPRRSPLRAHLEQVTLSGDARGIREIAIESRDGDLTSTALELVDGDHRFTDAELEALFVDGIEPAAPRTP